MIPVAPPIVVGPDYSEASRRVLNAAVRVATRWPAQLEIVYVAELGQELAARADDRHKPTWLASKPDTAAFTIRKGLPWVELARHAG